MLFWIFAAIEFYFCQEYQLVWQDEFDGEGLPQSLWIPKIGYTTGEPQCHTNSTENLFVKDSLLHIVARKNHLGYDYTSALVTSSPGFLWKFGKLEARLKIPVSGGTWPAFWTMGTKGGGWPQCGEVDIMESFQKEQHSNVYWSSTVTEEEFSRGQFSLPNSYYLEKDPDFFNKFHV
jgi:beta-glucanase (GH16 family)